MFTEEKESLFDLEFDMVVKSSIESVAKWGKIMAIISFVSIGVSIVVAIFGKTPVGNSAMTLAFTLLVSIISGVLSYFMWKFATHTLNGIKNESQLDMEKGMENFNYYNKMIGILLLIFVSICVLSLLIGIIARGA